MHRVVRRVEVQHDLRRRRRPALQEHLHEQPLDRREVQLDLLVAPRPLVGTGIGRRQLQAIQGRLACQGAPLVLLAAPVQTLRVRLPHHARQQRVAAQLVVVVEVLVALRHPIHPLPQQRQQGVFYPLRVPPVPEAPREPLQEPRPLIGPRHQQCPCVGSDPAAPEIRHHIPRPEPLEIQLLCATLCHCQVVLSLGYKPLLPHGLYQKGDLAPRGVVRNAG